MSAWFQGTIASRISFWKGGKLMNKQISPLDWQNLSNYLDSQLSPDAQKRLEADLLGRPELKQALEDLRFTRLMLKSLPRQRAPKNFTLSASILPQRAPRFPFIPAFSLASALCTILLLLSFLFQPNLTSGLARVDNFAPQSKSAAPMAADSAAAAPTPEVFTWGVPPANRALGMGGGNGGGGGPDETSPAAPALAPAPLAPASTPAPNEKIGKPTPVEPPPPSAPSAPAAAAPLAPPASPPIEGGGPILGLRPTLEQGLETQHLPVVQNEIPAESWVPQSGFPIFQVLLASLAVLFALAAVLFRFRYRQ
jgi:anti-sigma factor RsiW